MENVISEQSLEKAKELIKTLSETDQTFYIPKCKGESMNFWIVGQITHTIWDLRTQDYKISSWEFQGIFSSKELAIAACKTSAYFVMGPFELNKELPDETVNPDNAFFPFYPL